MKVINVYFEYVLYVFAYLNLILLSDFFWLLLLKLRHCKLMLRMFQFEVFELVFHLGENSTGGQVRLGAQVLLWQANSGVQLLFGLRH